MTLLELVQRFCERTGLPQPGEVVGSSNAQILQIKGLCDEIMEDLNDRGGSNGWQALSREITFTTVDGENQGSLSALVTASTGTPDNGFRNIRNDTIWNRTTRLPIFGPLAPREWQAQKANPATGPWQQYRIFNGYLLFNPVGVAGQTCVFEITTQNMVVSVDGLTPRPVFAADDDIFLLDYKLLLAGIRWKWKSEKGLDYSEDFAHYERLVANTASHDGTKKTLSMNGPEGTMYPRPGIFISPGSWPIH